MHHAAAHRPEITPHYRAEAEREIRAFQALARLIDEVDCHHFRYSRLDDALQVFNELADDRAAG